MKRTLSRPYLRVATSLFRLLDTPKSLACFILANNGEWDQLAAMASDPNHYLDTVSGAKRYFHDAQATDFLRKSADLPCSFDKKKAAIEMFDASEKQCAETNYLLEYLHVLGDRNDAFGLALLRVLSRTRKIIRGILGPLPHALSGRFGGGTVFELQGSAYTTLADKLWITPHVTQEAEAVWRHTIDGSIIDRQRLELGLPYLSYVKGNRFTTVPKTSKTDRGICVEPLGNLYCQLGVGSYLKERLAAVGLFVQRNNTPLCPFKRLTHRQRPNGQTIHRQLAVTASTDGSLSTIDLSNASDTVAFQLVKALLPRPWFELLASLRSPFTKLTRNAKAGPVWVRLEKFSSMGNGFTFELETLIFAALAAGVTGLGIGSDIHAYGDDIIVPTRASGDVLAILKAVGFTPNLTKTYTTGFFRESCGGDYFCGFDVRPVFSKAEPDGPMEWIALHNSLIARFPRFKHLFRVIVEQVPERFKLFGPPRAGDTVFLSHDKSKWKPSARRGLDGDRFYSIHHPNPGGDGGVSWIKCVKGSTHSSLIPLDRWGDEFTVSLALHGVASLGLVPRGAVPSFGVGIVSVS